jgi:hypothetical protein
MKAVTTAVAAMALAGALAIGGGRSQADEDCDTVIKSLNEALQIGLKNYQETVEELKKKSAAKNKFCSATGEYVGTSRAFRAVAAECLPADQRAGGLAELDKAIKVLEGVVESTCK